MFSISSLPRRVHIFILRWEIISASHKCLADQDQGSSVAKDHAEEDNVVGTVNWVVPKVLIWQV